MSEFGVLEERPVAQPISRHRVCAHCGLPAAEPSEPAFCCNGCRGAYELIHGWGLESYYDLRDATAVNVPGARDASDFGLFDEETFLGRSIPRLQDDGCLRTKLTIQNLHCAACAWLIESVATQTTGWQDARVRMNDHTLEVVFDPQRIRLSQIAGLLHRVGYELTPLFGDADEGFLRENRVLLVRIAIAGFCAANAMWIAIAIYAGDATGLADSHRTFLRWMGTGLGVAAVAFPGRTFFVGALAAIRTRTPHMDLPVALGLLVGTVSGLVSLILGQGEIYFDTLAVLVFLLLIGRWIQFRGQHRAAKAVDLLLRITPHHARRILDNGETAVVPTDTLRLQDRIRVAAGESFPADGAIIRGTSRVDRSLLTGESRLLPVETGDTVESGSVNVRQELDVVVEAVGCESRVGKVMQLVEQASTQRAPVVQFADRIGGVFVVLVSILSVLTFAWWVHASWQQAAMNATSLLIVACPCALALATPLAIAVAIGQSAKRRIFIRDGGTLTRLSHAGTIWFDKTGTLTEGRPTAVLRWGDARVLAMAAAVERSFNHPIADAIVRAAESQNLAAEHVEFAETRTGGVYGRWGGEDVWIGNHDFLIENGVTTNQPSDHVTAEILDEGSTPILIAVGRTVRAVVSVSDPLKPDAKQTIRQLTRSGWRVGILSGDHPEIVTRIGNRLGLADDQCFGGLSPEQKLQRIHSDESRCTVMIGDGANDAAALAAADVGIAVRGGAEVSLRAAPVFIASGELTGLCRLMAAASRTTTLIHTAIAVSLMYNLISIGLAITGNVSPLAAAILMPISSVTVLSLCLVWPIYSEPC